jgi:hypothetical protein
VALVVVVLAAAAVVVLVVALQQFNWTSSVVWLRQKFLRIRRFGDSILKSKNGGKHFTLPSLSNYIKLIFISRS